MDAETTTISREMRAVDKAVSRLEVRAADEGSDSIGTLRGYAAVFGKPSVRMGYFVEYIDPKAFDRSLGEDDDVRAFAHHSTQLVIGRRSAGTLRLSTDKVGLLVEIDLPDTQAGRDLKTSVTRGDLDGMSFGFKVREDSWKQVDEVTEERTLLDVELHEVSVVTFPAYPDTSVGLRSIDQIVREAREARERQDKERFAARDAAIAEWNKCTEMSGSVPG
jgi:HK97 family phage prohead protease